jgi:hypothetical protein
VFRRVHVVKQNSATVYVTRCQPVEVIPWIHTNSTNRIPAEYNNTDVFIDPISFVIKPAAPPMRCNDIVPPPPPVEAEWAMVQCIPVDTGLQLALANPHQANQHPQYECHGPWLGKKQLQP